MVVYGKTDTGRMRKNNEDSFFFSFQKIGMFDTLMIVADGMGGHSFGEVASGICVESVVQYISEAAPDNPAHILSEAVFMANYAVWQEARRLGGHSMGTTLVLVGISAGICYIANVGDSRLYLINEKENSIRQITRDHSYVEEQVAKGLMVRGSEEYNHSKNVITRAIGIYMDVEADQFEHTVAPGDFLLACSDGLSNMVPDIVMKNLVLDDSFTLEKRVDTLISTANRNGGRDNITVVLCDCNEVNT